MLYPTSKRKLKFSIILLVLFIVLINTYPIPTKKAFAASLNDSSQQQTKQRSSPEDLLKIAKLEAEVEKLRAEIKNIKINNEATGPLTRRISAILSAIGGLAGALVGILLWVLGRAFTDKFSKNQDAKLEQDKELSRETHNLELFRALSDENHKVQLAAASVLLHRLLINRGKNITKIEEIERKTIIEVLLAVIREKPSNESSPPFALWKLIADKLIKILDAIVPEDEFPSEEKPSPLKEFDFQKVHLVDAWWKRVDARDVDFFHADLSKAGLAESFLIGAIFYEAKLEEAVLRNANLTNANLYKANLKNTDLRGANLTDAIIEGTDLTGAKYNSKTLWPADFDLRSVDVVYSE